MNNVLEGIEAARNSDEKLSLIVALFHIYHFIEDKSTKGYLNIQDLSDILNWVSKQPDVKTMTIPYRFFKEESLFTKGIISNLNYNFVYFKNLSLFSLIDR